MSAQPSGMIARHELLAILQALGLTDCDRRTLAIVAQALALGPWFAPPPETVVWIETKQAGLLAGESESLK